VYSTTPQNCAVAAEGICTGVTAKAVQISDSTITIVRCRILLKGREGGRFVRQLKNRVYPVIIASLGVIAAVGGYMAGR
jgi:hypothetical protein